MLKIKFVFILSTFLLIFYAQTGSVYASDQDIQLSPNLGLTFNFPFIIDKIVPSNNFLFNIFYAKPQFLIQVQPTLTPSPTPTLIPTLTPTLTPTPTTEPTPTDTPTSIIVLTLTITPTPEVSTPYNPPKGSLSADKIFDLVNTHRQNMGLPKVILNDKVCAVAQSRAPELAQEFATGNLHQGIRARHLPYWNHENIISTTSEQAAVDGWLSDDIHRKGIEGDYKYSCVACWTNKCVQEFTNLVNK